MDRPERTNGFATCQREQVRLHGKDYDLNFCRGLINVTPADPVTHPLFILLRMIHEGRRERKVVIRVAEKAI